jgi:O-acetyl-ADP-ribose deacetylase (regulator of RNase III)
MLRNTQLEIISADITTLHVDAIVNAANKHLMAGGGVCGAIHKAAGAELEQECNSLDGCAAGQAKITGGYNLPAKFVIHTVAPQWLDGKRNEAKLLASCYKESMLLASAYGVKSIAFPALGCGIYRYPIEEACKIAVSEIVRALSNETSVEKVIFSCIEGDIKEHLEKALKVIK